MTVKSAIKAKVANVYGDQTPNVYQGNDYDYDYDGTRLVYGWWYKPFNAKSVYLGTSKVEATEMLEQIRQSWQEV